MVECIFLFPDRLHRSLQYTLLSQRQGRDRLPGRTPVLPAKGLGRSSAALRQPRIVCNQETSSRLLFHGGGRCFLNKHTTLKFLSPRSTKTSCSVLSVCRMRMKFQFFTWFMWKLGHKDISSFWIILHDFWHTFLLKDIWSDPFPKSSLFRYFRLW